MEELKCPGKVILNGSSLDEPILIDMYQLQNDMLKPRGEQFSDASHRVIQQGYRPKIIDRFWIVLLRDQGDIRIVDAREINTISEKIREQSQEIWFYDRPTLFNKSAIETIRARSMVVRDFRNHLVVVFFSEIIY